MTRTFPSVGVSPIDVYNTQVRPGAYFEHVVALDGTARYNVQLVGTPTFSKTGDYANLWIETTPLGVLGTWASSIFAKITQSVESVDGYISAAEFEVNKSGSITNRVYGVIVLNNGNNIAGAQSSSAFIICREYGSNVLNALVKFGDNASYSATASAAVVVSAAADSTATHKVRFITTIAGVATPMWFLATTTVPG